jgi:hypothetical protein
MKLIFDPYQENRNFEARLHKKKYYGKYEGKNRKTYEKTGYELLGFELINPRIFLDEKGNYRVYFYPSHDLLFELFRESFDLKDGYTLEYYTKFFKLLALFLVLRGKSTKELIEIIEKLKDFENLEGDENDSCN